MDHVWDGFYTGHLRLQKFISVVDLRYDYNLYYSGTPPKDQKFRIDGVEMNQGAIFKILYPNAGTYWLYDSNGDRIQPIVFDPEGTATTLEDITRTSCGEHRYDMTTTTLEFYMNQGCQFTIKSVDAIQGFVRIDWTMAEFFADDGVSKFINRLASVLNIAPSRIKVAGVRAGSVIIDTIIEPDPTNTPQV